MSTDVQGAARSTRQRRPPGPAVSPAHARAAAGPPLPARTVCSRPAQRPRPARGNVSARACCGKNSGQDTRGEPRPGRLRACPRGREPREAARCRAQPSRRRAGSAEEAPAEGARRRGGASEGGGRPPGETGRPPAPRRPCWPGAPSRSAPASGSAPTAWRAPTSRCGRAARRPVEVCLFDDGRRTRDAGRADRADPRDLARLRAGRRARPALRLPGARPLGPVDGRPLEPGEAAPRPVRAGRRRRLHACRPRCTGMCGTGRSSRSPTPCATTGTRRRTCPRASWSTTTTTGPTTTGPRHPGRTPSSTSCTCAASPGATRASRGACGAPTRGWRTRRRSSTWSRLGVTAVELLPVHQFAHEDHLLRRGLRNYWGYNSIGYFAPHAGYAACGYPRAAGRRVQARWCTRCTRPASRSSSTSSTTTPPRAASWGPTLSLRGIDNRGYYRLQTRRPPLRRLHGLRQHPARGPAPGAAADHRLAALLGDGDGRGRLPLRPGRRAGPLPARRGHALPVPRRASRRTRCCAGSS